MDQGQIRRSLRWAAAIVAIAVLLDTAWTPSDAASTKHPAHIDPALLAQAKTHPMSSFDVIVQAASQKTRLAPHAKANTADRAGKAVKRAGGTHRFSGSDTAGTSSTPW